MVVVGRGKVMVRVRIPMAVEVQQDKIRAR